MLNKKTTSKFKFRFEFEFRKSKLQDYLRFTREFLGKSLLLTSTWIFQKDRNLVYILFYFDGIYLKFKDLEILVKVDLKHNTTIAIFQQNRVLSLDFLNLEKV